MIEFTTSTDFRIVAFVTCFLISTFPLTLAFTSLHPASSLLVGDGVKSAFRPAHSRSFVSAIEEEEKLSENEERILFGDEARVERHPPFPGVHRKKDKFGNVLEDYENPPNPLDHAKNPLVNKLHTMRETVESCPEVWSHLASFCPDRPAIFDEHLCDEKIDLTFQEMDDAVSRSAAVFANLGVVFGTHVAVLGENSAHWLTVDHGIQRAGGVSAVRGADAPSDELRYIYEHSDSAGIVVLQGPKLFQKLAASARAANLQGLGLANAKHGRVRFVILMNREKFTDEQIAKMADEMNVKIAVFGDLLKTTPPLEPSLRPKVGRNDVATIVYTSGTTGRPKGAMLRHGNLLHQTTSRVAPTKPYEDSDPLPGDTMLALLPVWHITERTFELWMITRGCRVVYSNVRYFRNDLAKHKPEWLVLVPRVLEKVAAGVEEKFNAGSAAVKALVKIFTNVGQAASRYRKIVDGLVVGSEPPGPLEKLSARASLAGISVLNAIGNKLVWRKVQDGFGGNLRAIICGGSALAGSLETFYDTAGIRVLVGYGLTECSPLLSFRRSDRNLVVAGCAGRPCTETEIRIVDPDSLIAGEPAPPALPDGQAGVIIGRGPQIMLGYYKDEKATAQAINPEGWFNTGDIGKINPATGDLILTGRAKDTIVLSNGENVEPGPIEDAIVGGSSLVDQVMLMGQDGRRLVAIVVVNPTLLSTEGFLTEDMNEKELQSAVDKVNDPKMSWEECKGELSLLRSYGEKLGKDSRLKSRLLDEVARATADFRKWEQVSDLLVMVEPFAMANGLLTQSYKVKRNVVVERYQGLISA